MSTARRSSSEHRQSGQSAPLDIPAEITDKRLNYRLWFAGVFGNKLRTWDSYCELRESGYAGLVTMRYKAGWGVPPSYRLAVPDVPRMQAVWAAKGLAPELTTFNEDAPDDRLVMQGELMEYPAVIGDVPRVLTLRYSCVPGLKMREAMADPRTREAYNLEALLLLRRHLNPSSLEDLRSVLDMFPSHVVEFSAYECELGNIPHRNTVVWEVRKY